MKTVTKLEATLPEELLTLSNWACWKYEAKDGKKTKVPYNPLTGHRASVTNPTDWTTYSNLGALKGYEGTSFVFKEGEGIVGIDLDKVYYTDQNLIDPAAEEILEKFKDTYIEWSPSGTGFHILCRGMIKHNGKNVGKDKWLEQYDRKRCFTVTGKSYSPTPKGITDQQANLDWLHNKYFTSQVVNLVPKATESSLAVDPFIESKQLPDKDKKLLAQAMAHPKTDKKFKSLFVDGDLSAYVSETHLNGDHSSADMALMGMLAAWTGKNGNHMRKQFVASKLAERAKGQEKGYLDRTIQKAIEGCTETYHPTKTQRKLGGGLEERLKHIEEKGENLKWGKEGLWLSRWT